MVNNLLTSFTAHVPYDWHAISPAINPLGFLVRESECTGRAMRPQRKRPERVERTGLLMVRWRASAYSAAFTSSVICGAVPMLSVR